MYVAVKGGERAIDNAHAWLAEERRGDPSVPDLTIDQIREQMRLAVNRVMAEGSLYDPDLAALASGQMSQAFALAFALAVPFLVGSLLYNLALGAINRAMPQLMVAFVGAPALTWAALVLLLATAPLILSVWHEHFDRRLADPLGLGLP